jgi:hypothetical protein
LAERTPGLLREYEWYRSLLAQWDADSLELLEAVAAGKYGSPSDIKAGGYRLPGEVARLLKEKHDGEDLLIARFEEASSGSQKAFLASVICEFATTRSFLALANDPVGRQTAKRQFHDTLTELTYRKNPLSPDGSTYELVPVDATQLRQALFRLTLADDPDTASFALSCLEKIDELRDEYGSIDTEPRHPDIATGRAWPQIQIAE